MQRDTIESAAAPEGSRTDGAVDDSRLLDWLAGSRLLLTLSLGLKALIVVALVGANLMLGLTRFADRAMPARLLLFPVLIAAVPVCWAWLNRRRPPERRLPYPALADLLITLPFAIDMGGNALDLYDTINVFDDVCHFVNWALLSAGFGVLLLARRELAPWVIAGLCIAFGTATAVLWEIFEFLTFVTRSKELPTAYPDTIGDLSLGLAGTVLAAVLIAAVARRR